MTCILSLPALAVQQPIGEFFVGVMQSRDLLEISSADMRRISGELDAYVGIQRKLSAQRVKEIGAFVNSIDAAFPTSVILSVAGSCAEFDSATRTLSLFSGEDERTGEPIPYGQIANILDGQHRIEGLRAFRGESFEVPVSIFVDADLADQAYVFATVNLAQTKVNKSLVYDLLDYSQARSPQKSCHDIAVALDSYAKSPFWHLIKRLGTATPGRAGETLAQATFVTALLPFISSDPQGDRYLLAKGKRPSKEAYKRAPLRDLWLGEQDTEIAKLVMTYFGAIKSRWPKAWKSRDRGDILPRTNGFRAAMRFFKLVFLRANPQQVESPRLAEDFCRDVFNQCKLSDGDFSTENFPPGATGEKKLFDKLRDETRL